MEVVVTVSVEPLTVAVTPEGALAVRLTEPVKPEVVTVAAVPLPAVTEPLVGVRETDAVTGGGVLLAVYRPMAVALGVLLTTAMALTMVLPERVMGPAYEFELLVGVLPSVV